ncbi:condensation domain-containing protein [Actinoplanes sp. NPDC051470]|uniref:condensation domain-containing protein n=1 Tax=Actinoplanes sp. NPDC051470 TaxID=3157224 RepID=UPI0034392F73
MSRPVNLPPNYEAVWERMVELHPADPGQSRFGGLVVRQIDGPLDPALLRRAIADVTRRHDILRISVRTAGPDAVLDVHTDLEPDVRVADLAGCPPAEQDAYVSRLVSGERRRAYRLAEPPLWSAHLVRLTPVRNLLVIGVCHLLLDGWSANVLFEEVFGAYAARSGGPALPAVPMDLPAVTAAQRADLSRSAHRVEQWARELWVPEQYLRLPVRTPGPTEDLLADAGQPFAFGDGVVSSLADLAWRNRTTPFVVLTAAYATAMSVRMDTPRLVVSTTILGRLMPGTHRLLGQFTRDVFFPFTPGPRSSLEEVVRHTHAALAAAVDSATSFTTLARLLHPGFAAGRPWSDLHLFDAYLQPVPPAVGPLRYGDLTVRAADPAWTPAPEHAVTLSELLPGTLSSWIKHGAPHLTVNADRRGGVLGFNRTFFEPGLAESLVADQLAVARLLAADPATPLAEAHRLLAQRPDAAGASAG